MVCTVRLPRDEQPRILHNHKICASQTRRAPTTTWILMYDALAAGADLGGEDCLRELRRLHVRPGVKLLAHDREEGGRGQED